MCPNKLNDLKFLNIQNNCGIFVLSGITESATFGVLKANLKDKCNQCLCFNLSPYELRLSKTSNDIMEINKFVSSIKIINKIRNFSDSKNLKFVIINNWSVLQNQEKWFLINLLDLANAKNLKIIILANVISSKIGAIPSEQDIKSQLDLLYNYCNHFYYVNDKNLLSKEEKIGDIEIYENK